MHLPLGLASAVAVLALAAPHASAQSLLSPDAARRHGVEVLLGDVHASTIYIRPQTQTWDAAEKLQLDPASGRLFPLTGSASTPVRIRTDGCLSPPVARLLPAATGAPPPGEHGAAVVVLRKASTTRVAWHSVTDAGGKLPRGCLAHRPGHTLSRVKTWSFAGPDASVGLGPGHRAYIAEYQVINAGPANADCPGDTLQVAGLYEWGGRCRALHTERVHDTMFPCGALILQGVSGALVLGQGPSAQSWLLLTGRGDPDAPSGLISARVHPPDSIGRRPALTAQTGLLDFREFECP